MANFTFLNAYVVNTGTTEADKEQNGIDFTPVALGTAFADDKEISSQFSGNDVVVQLSIGGTDYYGWISRPIKSGGKVKGFYFWSDPDFVDLATATADGNADGDSDASDNIGFVLVVDQAYFDGLATVGGLKNVGSSSDRVDSNLNSILPVNSAPVGVNDSDTVLEDAASVTGNVLDNDTDADSNPLEVTEFSIDGVAGTLDTPYSIAGVGTFTLDAEGNYTFEPATDFSGAVPQITYTLQDSNGATATALLNLSVTAVNDAPSGADDTITVFEGGHHTFSLVDFGFSDSVDNPENNFLAVKITTLPGLGALTLDGVAVDAGDSVPVADLPLLRFTPVAGASGAGYASFTFQLQDDGGTENSGVDLDPTPNTLIFDITDVNSTPSATADTASAVEAGGTNNGTAGTDPTADAAAGLLANDTDPDGAVTAGTSHEVSSAASAVTANTTVGTNTAVVGQYGTLTVSSDGSYTYSIEQDNSAVQALRTSGDTLTESFDYVVTDQGDLSDTGTLTVTIEGANDVPSAADDTNIAKETTSDPVTGFNAEGNVLTNDSDPDSGDTKTITGISNTASMTVGTVTVTEGSAQLNFVGDNGFSSVNAGKEIYVQLTTDTSNYRGLFSYDSGTTSYTQVEVSSVTTVGDDTSVVLTADPTHYADGSGGYVALGGTIASFLSTNAAALFKSSTNAVETDSGSAKTATVTTTSSTGSTELTILSSPSGSVTIGMSVSGTGVPDGTKVTDVTYTAGVITGITLDSELTSTDGGAFTFSSSVSAGASYTGAHGSLTLNADGSYVYTPVADNPDLSQGDSGLEIFEYTMQDTGGLTDTATLTITVYGSGTADPVAVADTAEGASAALEAGTGAGVTASGNVLDNDTDPQTDATTVTKAGVGSTSGTVTGGTTSVDGLSIVGSYGTLVLGADGTYIYTPDDTNVSVNALRTDSDTLTDQFFYRVEDTGGNFSETTLTVTIKGANDAPTAVADTAYALEAGGTANATGGIDPSSNLLTNDSDVDDGDTLTVSAFSHGAGGVGTLDGATALSGDYGTLTLDVSGAYTYTLTNGNADVQALQVGDTLTETFSYTLEDTAGATDNTPTLTITIAGANDAPVNTVPGAAYSVDEASSDNALAGLSVADVDSATLTTKLTVIGGTLAVGTLGTATITVGAQDTATLTLSGSPAEVASALATITYTPDDGFNGTDTLTLVSTDAEGLVDTDSVGITVGADTRALTVTGTTVNEASDFALFTVTGVTGQRVQLSVADVDTTIREDYTGVLEYYDGTDWQAYTPNDWIVMPAANLLVRTGVLPDLANEGAEDLRLSAFNRAGVEATGDTTIVDNGTGVTYDGTVTTGVPNSATDDLDDDRPLSVNDIEVNEASSHAVFAVGGADGQVITLALVPGSATSGVDYGGALEVWDGTNWVAYGGSATFNGTTMLVRTTITNDDTFEGAETFALRAANAGGASTTGTAILLDDGTGLKFDGIVDGGGDPVTNDSDLDNDLSVTVSGVGPVNESSDSAMFSVTASQGAALTLALSQTGASPATVSGFSMGFSTDGGTTWTPYSATSTPVVPGTIGGGTDTVYVRVDITSESDTSLEESETFSLSATIGADGEAPLSAADEVEIVDDGTGRKYDGTLTGGTPNSVDTDLDNDTSGGMTVSGGPVTTRETGTTDQFTVVLDSEPSANVTVTLSGLDSTEGSLSATTLTFTSANWNVAQTVTVTGVDDTIVDGDINYTLTATTSSTDGSYDGVNAQSATISVTNEDDDTAEPDGSITVSGGRLTTSETGITDQFTVELDSAPTANVTLSIGGLDSTEGQLSVNTLTFTSANWNVPQTVTVTGVDDPLIDGDKNYSLDLIASSDDPDYGGSNPPSGSVRVTNEDDDSSGLTVRGGLLTTSEDGDADSFTVRLDTKPSANVVVSISGLDDTEGQLSTNSLTFTPANWDTKQTVTVTGEDDPVIDGSRDYVLTLTTSSSDANYGGLSDTVRVMNTDNDVLSGMTISGGPLNTSETGTSDQFTVMLDSIPSADVLVTITGLDGSEGFLSKSSLTFTTANWNVAQTITVTGVDDPLVDGTQDYTLTLTTSSSGDNYGGANSVSKNVEVSNTDDDTLRIDSIIPGDAVPEGQSLEFEVTLNGETSDSISFPFQLGGAADSADWSKIVASDGVVIDLQSGRIEIPAGVVSFTITIETLDDLIVEDSRESLTLTVDDVSATGEILDNDTKPVPPVIVDVSETPTDPTPSDLLTGDTTQLLKITGTPELDVVLYTREGELIDPAKYSVTEISPGVFELDARGIELEQGDYFVRQVDEAGNESEDSNSFTVDSIPELEENTAARVVVPEVGLTGNLEVIDQERKNLTPFQLSTPPDPWYDSDGEAVVFGIVGGTTADGQVILSLANGSSLELNVITGEYLYRPSPDATVDTFITTVRDPGNKGGNLAITFEVRDLLDRDGVPADTEEELSNRITGTADNNGDGVSDAVQNAVTTMAWTDQANFDSAVEGKFDEVSTKSVITVVANESLEGDQVNEIAQLIGFDVMPVDRDGKGGLPATNLDDVGPTPWEALSFSIEPLQSLGLIDADPGRPGLQQRVTIDISLAGIKEGEFTSYVKWISTETILSAIESGVSLVTLDGVTLDSPSQEGWYDFTQRTPGGDGAKFISVDGVIVAIELILTDNAFGDVDFTDGRFSDPGMPVGSADLFPPRITGPSGGPGAESSYAAIPENTSDAFKFVADELVTWSLEASEDSDRFLIDSEGSLTFNEAPDYELPVDSDTNNQYELIVRATDLEGNSSVQNVLIEVLDVPESVPIYGVELSSGDTALLSDLNEATQASAQQGNAVEIEFWAMPEQVDGTVPLLTWENVLTGDLFYGPEGTEPPYDCYILLDVPPLGYVYTVGLGESDVRLWIDPDGITQIVTQASADDMGLSQQGYSEYGVLFDSASTNDDYLLTLVGVPQYLLS